MSKEIIKINKRLDRLEECLNVVVDLIYSHARYLEQQEQSQRIEFAKGMTEEMYEEQTGLDVITGEKIDEHG
tara:strand:- start:1890 stop:2105 length:216 start_codon:yes stop_codon:yes gene_type:complete